jgi:cytochrome c nitrite reductase small subunit
MRGHYDSWLKSSHRAVAVCNDCHTPVGLVGKYTTKAFNGFRHSFAFTTGRFPDPIRIHSDNLRITDDACRKCHVEVVDMIEGPRGADRLSCIRCHAGVGHS